MKTATELLDDIIEHLIPEEVPTKYIVMAKITDFHGTERIIRGSELDHVRSYPDLYNIAEARIILNVRKIKADLIEGMRSLYDEVSLAYRLKHLGE